MIILKVLTFLALFLGLVLAAEDLKVQRDLSVQGDNPTPFKKGGKGKPDTPAKPGTNQFLWSQVVTLENENTKDEHLAGLAKHAHELMRKDWEHWLKTDMAPKQRPNVMTALQWKNKVYLASSMKGDYSYVYETRTREPGNKPADQQNTGKIRSYVPDELAKALKDARAKYEKKLPNQNQHKNDGQCGEVFAAWTWLLQNGGQKLSDQEPKPAIVSWEWANNGEKDSILDPCTTEKGDAQWGCDPLCEGFLNLRVVDKKTKPNKDWPQIKSQTQVLLDPNGSNKEKEEDENCE